MSNTLNSWTVNALCDGKDKLHGADGTHDGVLVYL